MGDLSLMFDTIANGVKELFSPVFGAGEFSLNCFIRGLGEAVIVGAVGIVVLSAIAVLSAPVAIAAGIALAVYGVVEGLNMLADADTLSDEEKSKVLGEMFGGLLLGRAASPKSRISTAAKLQGVSTRTAKALAAVAKKHNVNIQMRPTTKYAKKLLKAGTHDPKPSGVKNKTTNKADIELGAESKLGEVVVFNPRNSKKYYRDADGRVRKRNPNHAPSPSDPEAPPEISKRFVQREVEFRKSRKIRKGKGDYYADEKGIVRRKSDDQPFTGDNDIYSITDAKTGKEVDLELKENSDLKADLYGEPIQAQHDAHKSWEPTTHTDKQIKNDIDQQHVSPKETDSSFAKKEKIVEYNSDGEIHHKYADEQSEPLKKTSTDKTIAASSGASVGTGGSPLGDGNGSESSE